MSASMVTACAQQGGAQVNAVAILAYLAADRQVLLRRDLSVVDQGHKAREPDGRVDAIVVCEDIVWRPDGGRQRAIGRIPARRPVPADNDLSGHKRLAELVR